MDIYPYVKIVKVTQRYGIIKIKNKAALGGFIYKITNYY